MKAPGGSLFGTLGETEHFTIYNSYENILEVQKIAPEDFGKKNIITVSRFKHTLEIVHQETKQHYSPQEAINFIMMQQQVLSSDK